VRGRVAAVAATGAAAVTACAAVAYEHVVPGADGVVLSPALSGDARFLAFSATATNLLGRVRTGQQVYVLDRRAHRLELASRTAGGAPGAGASINPSLSATGRFVAFLSDALNFVHGDQLFVNTSPGRDDPWLDVFVRDRAAHRTIVVSRSRSGRAANGCVDAQIAAGGRYVVLSSGSASIVRRDTNGDADVFVADLRSGVVRRVSMTAAGAQLATRSDEGAISGDGRLVAFHSTDAVPGRGEGIYLRDLRTGRVRWMAAGFTPSLSANGRVLAYAASDGVHAVDIVSGRHMLVGPGADVLSPQLSRDGATVVFARSHEIASVSSHGGTTASVVTVSGGQTVALGGVSATGRVVSFSTSQGLAASDTDSTQDVYLRP
jgi:Tol biopolymer transport system component